MVKTPPANAGDTVQSLGRSEPTGCGATKPKHHTVCLDSLITSKSIIWTSLVAQMVKHLPAIRETQVRSVDQEDPLEEIATHSSTLA